MRSLVRRTGVTSLLIPETGTDVAAPKSIHELDGHCTLTMTLRYMHLAPSALTEATGLLDNFGQPLGSAVLDFSTDCSPGQEEQGQGGKLSCFAHALMEGGSP